MEDDEETSEVPGASCSTQSSQSSIIIYCFLPGMHSYIDGTKDWKTMKKTPEVPDASCCPKLSFVFLPGMHSYIDGTKNLANMKKELRFKLPRTPLKVLRGEQDQKDIRDIYHEVFQSPGTTTEDPDDHRGIDDESRRSSVSRDYITTDIGETSGEGRARYLGGHTSSIESIDSSYHDNPNNVDNASKDGTTGSVNLGSADGDIDVDSDGDFNRSSLPRDEVSETNDNDDDTDVYSYTISLRPDGTSATREDNTHDNDNNSVSQGDIEHLDIDATDANTGSISEEAIELQVMGQAHHPPHTNTDKEDSLSIDDSHAL